MDADRAAAEVAGAIGAGQLILLTNAWLLRISRMNLLSFPTSTARMLFPPSRSPGVAEKKVLGAIEALNLG